MGKIKTYNILSALVLALLAIAVGFLFGHNQTLVVGLILGSLVFIAFLIVCLRNLQTGVFALIFSLPFERIPSASVGGVTVRASQIILIALIVSLIWNKLLSKRIVLHVSPYFIPYFLFLLSILASFYEMKMFSRGLSVGVFILFTSLVIWIIPAVITKKEQLQPLVKILFISTLIISIFGLYQFFGDVIGLPTTLTGLRELYTKVVFGFPRVQSTELEPLYLANFLIIPLSLALSYFIRRTHVFSHRVSLAVIGLSGLILILTLSRGGYAGMAVSLFVVFIASIWWLLTPRVILVAITTLAVLLVAIVGLIQFSSLGQKAYTETIKHFTQIGQDASALQRVGTYVQAEQAYSESPITGVGVGNFGPFAANYPGGLPKDGWAIVNNEPLELLAEMGILGLLSFSLFLVVLIWRSITAFFTTKDEMLKATMLGLIAAIIGVLVQYQFFSTLYIMHIWVLFALTIAVQNIIFQQAKHES